MAKSRTHTAPRRSQAPLRRPLREPRRLAPELLNRDPNGIYPVHRTELMPIAMASLILATLAFLVCAKNGWLMLYGDAVAHLGIARRILDARYPGLAQLGGVWLPLPHLLMLPFVGRMDWWQSGIAGAFPSAVAYIAGNLGLYRLARRLMPPNWAFAATAFVALNPNLLYLSTTAMTEPLFLALFVWSTVITMEAADALRTAKLHTASARMIVSSVLTLAMVLTRYDGWIIGAAAWIVLATAWFRSAPETRKQTTSAFVIATAITVAGPILWFLYNAKYQGDWLDFLRGPYSAGAIEKKTSPPSAGRYHGWHNPLYAFLYFTRAAQLDAAFWESGFVLFAGSLAGAWLLAKQTTNRIALLLWVPLPFYMYSIAWSSVPIFIPQLYPNAWYNSRYGMELLPAFAIFGTFAVWRLAQWLRSNREHGAGNTPTRLRIAEALYPASLIVIILNTFIMFGTVGTFIQAVFHKTPWTWVGRPPLVFDEGVVNSRTRIPFEKSLAAEMNRAPADATIMFDTTDHIGAVQDAGIPLKRLVSPLDSQSFDAAKAAPAQHANIVIALDKDPVAAAVAAHPQGLSEIEILCHTGQPCARIYRSDAFQSNARGNTP
ncbi:ArnT family glycosyltransferase [Terriglobus sp.]|uniref:ArnT family glycosyltransferase n=1 Tax=Terriglobus sp. TaxID=1889013 RepID=UPI003B007AD7